MELGYDRPLFLMPSGVLAWLRTAAVVPDFIGFAIGRTSFWDPLVVKAARAG